MAWCGIEKGASGWGLLELDGVFVREALGGGFVPENFAATGIDVGRIRREVGRVKVVQRLPLGIDAPQFTVEILVGAALPGMVGFRKVDLAVERGGDPGMVGELAAVIERDGVDGILETRHHLVDGVRDRGLGFAWHGTTRQQPGLAFHQGHDRALMTGTDNGVAFPVAKGLPAIDRGRTLGDVDAIRNEMDAGLRGSRSTPSLSDFTCMSSFPPPK